MPTTSQHTCTTTVCSQLGESLAAALPCSTPAVTRKQTCSQSAASAQKLDPAMVGMYGYPALHDSPDPGVLP